MPAIVHLRSSDGKIFQVDLEVVKCSETIMALLEKMKPDAENQVAVRLKDVKAHDLKMVLEWMKHHKNDVTPSHEENDGSIVIGEWDRAYLKRQKPMDFFEIILAADRLKISRLRDIACYTLGRIIHKKTPQEIRDYFGIENDFTPEEEEQIQKEIEWISRNQ